MDDKGNKPMVKMLFLIMSSNAFREYYPNKINFKNG